MVDGALGAGLLESEGSLESLRGNKYRVPCGCSVHVLMVMNCLELKPRTAIANYVQRIILAHALILDNEVLNNLLRLQLPALASR